MKTDEITAPPQQPAPVPPSDHLLAKWFFAVWAAGTALALAVFAKSARDTPNENHVPAREAIMTVLSYTGVTSVFFAVGAIIVAAMISSILQSKTRTRTANGGQWIGVTAALGLFAAGWFVVMLVASWFMHYVFEPAPNDC